jgi:beta-lactamase regulating signal transducer with metallopeptidase domain
VPLHAWWSVRSAYDGHESLAARYAVALMHEGAPNPVGPLPGGWAPTDLARAIEARHDHDMHAWIGGPAALGLGTLLAAVAAFWLVGAAWRLARLFQAWRTVRQLARRDVAPASARWAGILREVRRRVDVWHPVFLGVSPHVDGPVLIGWWRPTILLPPGPHDRLSDTEAEATLAHELAHVRRGDYAVNLVQSFAEAVLFYHPVMWWLGERVRDEREYCSDDLAHRSIRGSLMDYLRALATLESLRGRAAPEPAVAADGRSLFSRTQRLADLSRRTRRPRLDVDVLLVVVCLVGLWMPVLHVNRTASHASIAVMKHEMRLPRDFEPIVQNAGLSATLADRARVTPSAPARDLAGARAGARGGIDG